jgi:hypothetical protein
LKNKAFYFILFDIVPSQQECVALVLKDCLVVSIVIFICIAATITIYIALPFLGAYYLCRATKERLS